MANDITSQAEVAFMWNNVIKNNVSSIFIAEAIVLKNMITMDYE